MVIYGVALLAACMLLGIQMGSWLGTALGIESNVGGVGLAMLMLIVLSNLSKQRFQLSPVSESGIKFWSIWRNIPQMLSLSLRLCQVKKRVF